MAKITVKDIDLTILNINNAEYVCITDLARYKNAEHTDDVIKNWIRNRNTIELLGIWELLHNPNFKPVEFDGFRKEAGLNNFVLTPKRWIETTNAIGLVSKSGRYGGTYAHRDIALEFASWISIEFKLYLLKEFQRLKEEEQKTLGWSAKRELTKINYHIHTDAIKHNLIPTELTAKQTSIIYASEADVLNMALFGVTAKDWRNANPELKGNIRDYASINELICLSNMENLNAVFINEGLHQRDRLIKLNKIAIQQMRILAEVKERKIWE
ncbi:KilA-N domain-containing protein [Bacteroidales bacterium OttesenSCG-928-L03]|nr:KilA-N domain-containing protein [Bacteroidales bacterium OttesenSCG-928-L03]